jgi:signal transduction histidine kinase
MNPVLTTLMRPDLSQVLAAAAVCLAALAVARGLACRRELRRLRHALYAMPDGLALFDASDRLIAWNSAYAVLRNGLPLRRGLTYMQIVRQGLDADRFVELGVDKEAWLAERVRVRREGGSVDVPTLDGHWLRCSDRHTADGGIVTMFTDITDLKRAEEAMAHAHDLAQEASRIKSEFLANMSHEIRTPMNGILGMNALLRMSSLTPAQKHYAEVVQSSAEGLMSIFNDILDIARLEAGAVQMASVDFDLAEVLRAVEAEHQPGARAKGLELAVAMDPRDGPRLLGDPVRLRQVLSHLVGNAVKFTDQGGVTVAAQGRPLEGGLSALRIEVSDTGPGVAPDLKTTLFEPFRQGDGSTTRRYGGAGLGLSICRHAVRLMGGSIGVADREGGGSVFWIELILPQAKTSAAA